MAQLSKKKKILFILIAVAIGFIIALISAEILIRIVSPQNLSGSWRQYHESGLILNKDSGESRHQQGERTVTYNFTDFHTRNSRIISGTKKVLVLGDSFTFGWLLDYKDTYVAQLQEKAAQDYPNENFQFITAAAGGWGTASYCRYLEEFIKKIKPYYILVVMSTDDIGRSYKSGLYSFDGQNLKVEKKLYSRSREFIKSFPGYQFLLENSHLVQLSRKFLLSNSSSDHQPHTAVHGPRSRELRKRTEISQNFAKALFKRMKDLSVENQCILLVTTNGWGKPLQDELLDAEMDYLEPTLAFQSCAEEFFKSMNIPYFDSTNELNKLRSDDEKGTVIPMDCHPNEKGAALIADTIWSKFLKNNLVSKKENLD